MNDEGPRSELFAPKHSGAVPAADRFACAGLFLAVLLPVLAVSWGVAGGERVFVLYRAPKAACVLTFSWALPALLAWRRPELFSSRALVSVLRRPPVLLGAAFGLWAASSGLRALVPEYALYELVQIVSLGCLAIVLLAWTDRDPGVSRTIRHALVTVGAVVTGVGLLQMAGADALRELFPAIDPEIGVAHASLMGYKNPAAHAVAGQIFLLGALVAWSSRRWLRVLLALLLTAELAYLASLRSRTTILAVAAALAFVGIARLLRAASKARRTPVRLLRTGLPWAGAVLLFVLVVSLVAWSRPEAAERLRSMSRLFEDPGSYLETDRGLYLRNTLHMARHRPWGVGLGGWQTHYPVYRAHGRQWAFDETFEVRRAHADHVQVLGETGWLGLGLWLAWLGALVGSPLRRFWRAGSPTDLLVAAQVVVFGVAMATDYVVEIPYLKFHFALVAVLALARPATSHCLLPASSPDPSRAASRRRLAIAAVSSLVAAAALLVSVAHLRQRQVSAEIVRRSAALETGLASEHGVPTAELRSILELGRRYRSLPTFPSKTAHKDHLLLSRAARLLGDQERSLAHARRASELHPYSPTVLAWTARVVPEPCAEAWRRAASHVRAEATSGFELPDPRTDAACRDLFSRPDFANRRR